VGQGLCRIGGRQRCDRIVSFLEKQFDHVDIMLIGPLAVESGQGELATWCDGKRARPNSGRVGQGRGFGVEYVT